MTVVLPAPFGPIRAWRAPCSTFSDRSRVTLQAAEGFFQASGFQRDRHGASLSGTATTALRPANCRITRLGSHSAQRWMRSRPTSTITTSTSPIQNSQYCGVMV